MATKEIADLFFFSTTMMQGFVVVGRFLDRSTNLRHSPTATPCLVGATMHCMNAVPGVLYTRWKLWGGGRVEVAQQLEVGVGVWGGGGICRRVRLP